MNKILGLALVLCVTSAKALVISEVMYNPLGSDTGREWIEIYNDTNNNININGYKLFESNTNHSIVGSDYNLKPGEYAIIADNVNNFAADYPGFKYKVFDSAFSLSNSGEDLSLKDNSGNILHSINYATLTPSIVEGDTVSYASGTAYITQATPGEAYKLSTNSISNTSTSSSNYNNNVTVTRNINDINFINTYEEYMLAGGMYNFATRPIDNNKNLINNLDITWGMGDGGGRMGSSTNYTYYLPGTYNVSLEGSNSVYYGLQIFKVNVIEPDLYINSVYDIASTTIVEIKNDTDKRLNLGGLLLVVDDTAKEIAKNTFVDQGSTLKLNSANMNFASGTIYKLQYRGGKVLSTFDRGGIKSVQVATTTISSGTINISSTTPRLIINDKPKVYANIQPKTNNVIKSTSTIATNTINKSTTTVTSSISTVEKKKSFWARLLY